jgi:TonB family protein
VAALLFNHELAPARRKNAFGWSVVLHGAGIVALATMAQWLPTAHIEPRQAQVTPLYIPNTPPPPVEQVTPPPPKIVAKVTPPKLTLPHDLPTIEEKPKPVEIVKAPEPVVPKPQPPKEVVTGAFASNKEVTAPVRPKKELVTDSFASGSSAPVTLQKPAHEVQTGGFGDPNGVPSTSDKKGQITLARMGSFDLPSGPGNGNGTGGAHGARGTVASTGFGNGVAGPGEGDRQHTGKVVQTGFGEIAAAAPTARAHVDEKPALTPVEILYKPLPTYTQEARQMHLEGEVLVRVVFGASGNLHVEQVVKGLGHGLDEAALRAAQQIRFRPAWRNGQPYDSTALVHIVFELAN